MHLAYTETTEGSSPSWPTTKVRVSSRPRHLGYAHVYVKIEAIQMAESASGELQIPKATAPILLKIVAVVLWLQSLFVIFFGLPEILLLGIGFLIIFIGVKTIIYAQALFRMQKKGQAWIIAFESLSILITFLLLLSFWSNGVLAYAIPYVLNFALSIFALIAVLYYRNQFTEIQKPAIAQAPMVKQMTPRRLIISQIIIILASLAIPLFFFWSSGFLALGISGSSENRASDQQIVNLMKFLGPTPNRDAVTCAPPPGSRDQNPAAWAACDRVVADAIKKDMLQNEIRAIYFYIVFSMLYYGIFFMRNKKKKVAV